MAAECVDKIVGWFDASFCIGLNSAPSIGGTAPGNVGDTTM